MQRNYWPTKDWRTADPEAFGMDTEKLAKLETIINAEYSNMNGIVVVKNGLITYERYFNGYGPYDVHHVASVTKSILSLPLLGLP